MTKHKANDWTRMYGDRRRALDRQRLEECERQIAIEEAVGVVADELEEIGRRESIARAFGRPDRRLQ